MLNGVVCMKSWYVEWFGLYGKLVCLLVWFVWKACVLNGVVCLERVYVECCGMYGKLIC